MATRLNLGDSIKSNSVIVNRGRVHGHIRQDLNVFHILDELFETE